jgi:hypothetical protein
VTFAVGSWPPPSGKSGAPDWLYRSMRPISSSVSISVVACLRLKIFGYLADTVERPRSVSQWLFLTARETLFGLSWQQELPRNQ